MPGIISIILWVLGAAIGLFLLLLAVACLRTLLIKNKKPRRAPQQPPDEKKAAQYAGILGEMIGCETVNDPSVSQQVIDAEFKKLRGVLQKNFPLLFKTAEQIDLDSDALLLRWKGADSSLPAIVLMSHSDVVPAPGSWKRPPFGGEVAEGEIWGRGASDTKGSLCAILCAVEGLLAEGFVPACDVYISSSNNEETMGDGALRARDALLARGVKFALVSDEGGAVVDGPLPGLTGLYAMFGVVEKGYANVRFTAKSSGGHASAPPKNSPLVRLARFMVEVDKKPPFTKKIPAAVKEMFTALAPYMPFGLRLMFGNLWLFAPLMLRLMPAVSAQGGAMMATTCAFTMAQGSTAANVIPETASVVANLRFATHQGQEASLAAIKKVAGKYRLQMTVEYAHDYSAQSVIGSREYRYMESCVRAVYPEAGMAPYVMVGGTDARYFAKDCEATLRFAPLIMTKKQMAGIHGLNESIGVNALARGVEFYGYLIKNYKP